MDKAEIVRLEGVLNRAAEGLPKLTSKRMFGCHALKVGETIFAMVWKEGRINLKLPVDTDYNEMLSKSGCQPWSPGGRKMGGWLLVPKSFHSSPDELARWVHRAHHLCAGTPKKKSAPKTKAKGKAPSATGKVRSKKSARKRA